jgi:hypothetical protein
MAVFEPRGYQVSIDDGHIVKLTIPNGSADLVFEATERLVAELNMVAGPLASRKADKSKPGSKGDPVTLGQIVLAVMSGGVVRQIAQALVAYVKRNPRYVVQVDKIKITKDYASTKEMEAINLLVKQLSRKTTD